MELDDLDKIILHELMTDARQSFRDLSKKAHASVVTVAQRVRKMEKAGVIKGYAAQVSSEQLGFEITTVTEVTVSKGKVVEVERDIAKLPHVCAVYDVTGEEDSIVISKFKNREELSNFTKAVLALPHVERTNTHVVLNTTKENFLSPFTAE
ncbi:MAG TPA: Lrp/AsnC family transcriptional regulator [Nitrososphaerales archaeon]|nr:Lrp/AsnC family transcriptional regulator [Nitrososphaerales archaeon]